MFLWFSPAFPGSHRRLLVLTTSQLFSVLVRTLFPCYHLLSPDLTNAPTSHQFSQTLTSSFKLSPPPFRSLQFSPALPCSPSAFTSLASSFHFSPALPAPHHFSSAVISSPQLFPTQFISPSFFQISQSMTLSFYKFMISDCCFKHFQHSSQACCNTCNAVLRRVQDACVRLSILLRKCKT